jgi:hypothetical protein
MKLSELILEYNSNPFVSVVSSIDLKIREVDEAIAAGSNAIFKSSLKNQLQNLLKFVESASNWNIPESKLRSDFHGMLPNLKKHIENALTDAASGSNIAVKDHLFKARTVVINASHLKFGDIE